MYSIEVHPKWRSQHGIPLKHGNKNQNTMMTTELEVYLPVPSSVET